MESMTDGRNDGERWRNEQRMIVHLYRIATDWTAISIVDRISLITSQVQRLNGKHAAPLSARTNWPHGQPTGEPGRRRDGDAEERASEDIREEEGKTDDDIGFVHAKGNWRLRVVATVCRRVRSTIIPIANFWTAEKTNERMNERRCRMMLRGQCMLAVFLRQQWSTRDTLSPIPLIAARPCRISKRARSPLAPASCHAYILFSD